MGRANTRRAGPPVAGRDDIFAQLTLPKLAIRNPDDWTAHYRDILAFLQLPAITTDNR
jgi:hypothetical protein